MEEKMHKRRVERVKRREKRNKMLKSSANFTITTEEPYSRNRYLEHEDKALWRKELLVGKRGRSAQGCALVTDNGLTNLQPINGRRILSGVLLQERRWCKACKAMRRMALRSYSRLVLYFFVVLGNIIMISLHPRHGQHYF
jgi:hypothetical protein